MDGGAAQLLLRQLLAHARHHRRAGDEHLREALHHQRIVAGDEPRGAEPGDRTEAERDHRHEAEIAHHMVPARVRRNVSPPFRLQHPHRAASAGAVDQTEQGQAQLPRHLLRRHLLQPDRRVGRAAAHAEVVAGHHHRAPVHAAAAEDEVRRRQIEELAVLAVPGFPRRRADLVEAAGVEKLVDALAHRQLPGLVLPPYLVGAAHPPRQLLAPAQLRDLPLPAHPLRFTGASSGRSTRAPSPARASCGPA